MKLFLGLFLASCAIPIIYAESEKCYDNIKECHTTNYEEYIECITKRQKRSVECDSPCDSDNCVDTCSDCDCDSCNYSSCENNNCNSCCGSCCTNYNSCRSNHCCHKTCHALCKTTSCRSSCRRTCYDVVKKIEPTEAPELTVSASNSSTINNNTHNITTIIHLSNVINNTNIIDIPISINSTIQQNMSIINTGNGQSNTEKCCIVISPRQCVPHNEFPFVRCFHYRSNQCGNFCSADIVHKEQQQICTSLYPGLAPNCRQDIIYIPQPQPRCSYQSTWPYVACGIERSTSCAGCYGHYVDQENKNYMNCPSGCYDDGFGTGPYYRQGPFYRPNYMHTPCNPCFGYGNVGAYGGMSGEFGGFGGYGPMGVAGGMGGYVPFGAPSVGGFGDPAMPYGSWSPGEVNSFGFGNQTNVIPEFNSSNAKVPMDPLISVGPSFTNPLGYVDPFRASREVEIEVNYEPPSAVQAEVKIKPLQTDGKEETEDAITNTIDTTTTTKLKSKTTKKPINKKLA